MMIKTIDGIEVPVDYKPVESSKRICIFAHGITADKTEGGIFDRMASLLRKSGISTIQLDFRGHGDSELPSESMTIVGEMFDLSAVIEKVKNYEEIFLLSASFGAVSTGLLPRYLKNKINKLCLWNPVLSLTKTFIEPELDWQINNFGLEKIDESLNSSGKLAIDDSFIIGTGLLRELQVYNIEEMYSEYINPLLIIHGDCDTYVSYEIAKSFSNDSKNCSFVTISGSEHGFGRNEEEKIVFDETLQFFLQK